MRLLIQLCLLLAATTLPLAAQAGGGQYSTDYSHLYDIAPQAITVFGPSQVLSPRSAAECSKIRDDMQKQYDSLDTQHEKCLSDAAAAHQPKRNPANTITTCDFAACQNLHTAKNDAQRYVTLADEYAGNCEQAWHDAETARRKRKEEDDKRAEQQREDEQKRKDDADKQKADAQAQARSTANDDLAERQKKAQDAAAEQAKRDAFMIQYAAEQSAENKQALAERTAERQQQLADLDTDAAPTLQAKAAALNSANGEIAAINSRLNSNPNPIGTSNTVAPADDYGDPTPAAPPPDPPSPDFPPAAATSVLFAPAPDFVLARQESADKPCTDAELQRIEDELHGTTPAPTVLDHLHDGLNNAISAVEDRLERKADNLKDKYTSAKATISDLLDSNAVVYSRAAYDATKGTIPLPNRNDTDEQRADKVIGQAGIGLYKFTRYPPPVALWKYLKANVNSIGKDLGLATAPPDSDDPQ